MTARENRLSLNKEKKMSNKEEIDIDISLNQEGNYEKDEDIDFSLNLDKDENESRYDEVGKQTIAYIKNLMDERHELAEIKESMKYGLQTSKYPLWMRLVLSCKPKLSSSEDNENFQEMWQKTSKTALQNVMNDAIEHVENEIKEKEKSMQLLRKDAFLNLGTNTKTSGEKKREIDSEIRKLNAEYATKINNHRNKIRTTIPEREERGRGRRPSRFHRGGRGRRFHPYH